MNCEFVNRKGEDCGKTANKIGTSGKWNGRRLCNTHFTNTKPKSKCIKVENAPSITEQPPTPTNSPVNEPQIPEQTPQQIEDEIDIHPNVKELFKIPKHEQRSKEWFAERHQRLTASDVATAIGMNPYSSRADLVYKKCGGKDVFKGNAATKHGEKWEDTAIRIYCERYNDKSFEFGLLPHPTIPFLGGSPDGITAKGTVLEVKCPLMRTIIPGVVPAYYLPQVQIVMECTNLEVAHFIQYKPPPNEVFDVTIVPRDRNWFARYFPVMDFFWREVIHYREIGLEYNPVHIKKLQAEKDKENKEKKKSVVAGPPKLDTSQYLFQDDE
tara:strand:- start:321 stop:1298 length:978 start_codon:yes stop_codon:yes gene_type:complete